MPDEARDMAVFEEWMKHFKTSYETEALKLKRFETFKVALREAEEAFPLTKESMWARLNKFADLTDEEFRADYLAWEPESDDEDEKNGVHSWYLEERFASDPDAELSFKWFHVVKAERERKREQSAVDSLKRKGLCSCDEEDTEDQLDATVKRQRPCSCLTAPPPAAAAAEQRDVAAPNLRKPV